MDAVVLLSGGLDSTVAAYLAKIDVGTGKLHAISFDYGQKHKKELECACKVGEKLKVTTHPLFKLLGVSLFGSALTGTGKIPTGEQKGIPATWVPQRNSIFLSIAFGYAEVVGAGLVYIGVNSMDYSGYPDCRPEFIKSIEEALNLASKRYVETGKAIRISAPLQYMKKEQIIRAGLNLGVDFSKTWSCYVGGSKACGKCPSCILRRQAFSSLGMEDPVEYR